MAAPGVTVFEGGFSPGNEFVSASTSRGSCTGTIVATCNLGTLAKGASATVRIIRTPTIMGGVSEAVGLRGAVHDVNPANDSAVVVTTVWP